MSDRHPQVREAGPDDVLAICGFGASYVGPYYEPLIGAEAADAQVRSWWNQTHIASAVANRLVVVGDQGGEVVAVGQRGRRDAEHVIYKLYVHPDHRGDGLGPRMIDSLVKHLPEEVERVLLEHFAANERAARFYEREGFTVESIEPSATGDPALAIVWRCRSIDRS